VLNVAEFMSYAHEWLHRREAQEPVELAWLEPADTAPVNNVSKPLAKPKKATAKITNKTTVVTNDMDEVDFMNFTLEQLRQENGTTGVNSMGHFSDEALAAMEEEAIGEDFARYPFLY